MPFFQHTAQCFLSFYHNISFLLKPTIQKINLQLAHCFAPTLQCFAFCPLEKNCILEGLCPHNHHTKWHFNLPSPQHPDKSWQYWLISSSVFFSLFIFMITCCLPSFSQFSRSIMSDSLRPHGLQHARLPCPSPTARAYSNSRASIRWCHPIISSSVIPFSSHLQSFPASGSSPVSQFFMSGGQSIGISASASVLPMNIQDWSPLGWTGWISLQSKRLSRIFSNTTVQKHQLFSAQLSL